MLAELFIAMPAIAVVPLPGLDPGVQGALRLVALAVLGAIACSRTRGWTRLELVLGAGAGLAVAATIAAGAPIRGSLHVLASLGVLVVAVRGGRALFAESWQRYERAIAIAAAIVAVLAVLELLGVSWPWSYARRPGSTLGNRNHVATYLAMALPIVIASRRHWVTASIVTVIVASHCRGAYLGAVAAVIVSRSWSPGLVLGIALGLAPWPGVQFATSIGDAASRAVDLEHGSGLARVHQHELAIAALHDSRGSAAFGHGAGAWEGVASRNAHEVGEYTPRYTGGTVPNSEPVRILVEQGVIGLVLFGLAYALMVRVAWPRPAALAAVVAIGVCGLCDPVLVRPECLALLGGLLGALGPATKSGRSLVPWGCCAVALARLWSFHAHGDERTAIDLAQHDACDDAHAALDRFLTVRPYHWGARIEVARCFARRGDTSSARALYRDALRIEPHFRELVMTHSKGTDG